MSQEQMASQAKSQPSRSAETEPSKTPGEYLMKREDIPPHVSKLIRDKLGDGTQVHPAKENGAYKGEVIFTNDKFVGQTVGIERKTAVVHRRADIEMQGNELQWRLEHDRLNKAGVQVFYNGDKGKAYPFNLEKQQAAGNREHGDQAQAKQPALTAEKVMEQATKYAAENIKNAKQREAFLKHLSAATEQAKAPQETTKTAKAEPAKAKAADHGIER